MRVEIVVGAGRPAAGRALNLFICIYTDFYVLTAGRNGTEGHWRLIYSGLFVAHVRVTLRHVSASLHLEL